MLRTSNSATENTMFRRSSSESEDDAGSNENNIQPGEGSILESLPLEVLDIIQNNLNIRDQLTFNQVMGGIKTASDNWRDFFVKDRKDLMILCRATNSRDKLFEKFAEKKDQITDDRFDLDTYSMLYNQNEAEAENYRINAKEAEIKDEKIISEAIEYLKKLETLYKELWENLENIYQKNPTQASAILKFLLNLHANITYAYGEIEHNHNKSPLVSIAKTEIKKIVEKLELDNKFKNYFRERENDFEEDRADEGEPLISSNSETLNSILSCLKSKCPNLISKLVEQIVYSDPSSGYSFMGYPVKDNI
jgi:hypothetical protein